MSEKRERREEREKQESFGWFGSMVLPCNLLYFSVSSFLLIDFGSFFPCPTYSSPQRFKDISVLKEFVGLYYTNSFTKCIQMMNSPSPLLNRWAQEMIPTVFPPPLQLLASMIGLMTGVKWALSVTPKGNEQTIAICSQSGLMKAVSPSSFKNTLHPFFSFLEKTLNCPHNYPHHPSSSFYSFSPSWYVWCAYVVKPSLQQTLTAAVWPEKRRWTM